MIAQQLQRVRDISVAIVLLAMLGGCASAPQPTQSTQAKSRLSVGESAAQIALQQVGVPYRYGGQSPSGFDCSGLVHYSYYRAGKSLPRTTGGQWSGTTQVAQNDLQVGDLLFFSIAGKMSHVGLYIGNGRFVHAPSSGKTVSVQSLSAPFYSDAFLRAGRPR